MIETKTIGDKTLEQLLAEVKAGPGSQGDAGSTVREIAAATGWSTKTVQVKLQELAALGRLAVGRASRPRLCGGTSMVPVYRLAGKKQGGRK